MDINVGCKWIALVMGCDEFLSYLHINTCVPVWVRSTAVPVTVSATTAMETFLYDGAFLYFLVRECMAIVL